MNRYFRNSNQTASAFCAEASFVCEEMNSILMDTIMVSISLMIALMGIIIRPNRIPSMMRV